MKFSELNKEDKQKAVEEYIKGWKETHPDDEMLHGDAYVLCVDSDEDFCFDKKRFRMEYFETTTHIFEVEAKDVDEAIEKLDLVYLEGEYHEDDKKISSENTENDIGEIKEMK